MLAVKTTLAEIRHRLLRRLTGARLCTDSLFELVSPTAVYERPVPERHRIIFYLGHLEAFDWNLFRDRLSGLKAFAPEFDRLFAFGIDPVGDGLPTDVPADWPSEAAIRHYNRRVRVALDAALLALEPMGPHEEESPDLLLNVAIEHRLMHAETLAYLLHRLSPEYKLRPRETPRPIAPEAAPGLVDIPAGVTTLGRARHSDGFGWDNRWFYRGMFDRVPLPLQWPVYVSHAEASAYARWAGKVLPTESQWQRAAYGRPQGGENLYPWGDAPPRDRIGNFDFRGWDPVPVGAFPENRSAYGVAGLLGNGWEWTSTPFAPFDGFRAFRCYPGYSADFFDGRHYVLKGGSARTAACLLRRSFRNWFQPHYPYVYAGFRCVSNQACSRRMPDAATDTARRNRQQPGCRDPGRTDPARTKGAVRTGDPRSPER
jgi:iron(II)-dependent oxidoreductase